MSLLPIPHPILSSGVITKCQAGPPVLFSSFPLAVYFMHGRVYMSRLLSQVVLTLRFLASSTSLFSTSVSPRLTPLVLLA